MYAEMDSSFKGDSKLLSLLTHSIRLSFNTIQFERVKVATQLFKSCGLWLQGPKYGKAVSHFKGDSGFHFLQNPSISKSYKTIHLERIKVGTKPFKSCGSFPIKSGSGVYVC